MPTPSNFVYWRDWDAMVGDKHMHDLSIFFEEMGCKEGVYTYFLLQNCFKGLGSRYMRISFQRFLKTLECKSRGLGTYLPSWIWFIGNDGDARGRLGTCVPSFYLFCRHEDVWMGWGHAYCFLIFLKEFK
jgi:hypothetical protein